MTKFKAGDRVLCTNDRGQGCYSHQVRANTIYTVTEVNACSTYAGSQGLILKEVQTPPIGFWANSRFELVVEEQTDQQLADTFRKSREETRKLLEQLQLRGYTLTTDDGIPLRMKPRIKIFKTEKVEI